MLFSLNILSHFVHDSMETGWGIKWLGPFNQTRYKVNIEKKGILPIKMALQALTEIVILTIGAGILILYLISS